MDNSARQLRYVRSLRFVVSCLFYSLPVTSRACMDAGCDRPRPVPYACAIPHGYTINSTGLG